MCYDRVIHPCTYQKGQIEAFGEGCIYIYIESHSFTSTMIQPIEYTVHINWIWSRPEHLSLQKYDLCPALWQFCKGPIRFLVNLF